MPYTPDPTNAAQPADSEAAGTAAAEFRALKGRVNAVAAALQGLYPVGSVYMNATNSTNPATLLGFGTWVAFGAGRVPVGFNAADPLFDSAEETGGSKDAVVVAHTHTYTSYSIITGASIINQIDTDARFASVSSVNTNPAANFSIDSAGVSGTNANLQPYITVYMWKRTA
jgi:hypothetical protein